MKNVNDLADHNLLCLYGPSGSGKTRLLQGMENALSHEEVLRTGAESMIWEMTASLRFAEMTAFRRKYLGLANLLVDNLWVLEKRPAASAEICRLIRERQDAGQLTVVASDLPEHEWAASNSEVARLLAGGRSVILSS